MTNDIQLTPKMKKARTLAIAANVVSVIEVALFTLTSINLAQFAQSILHTNATFARESLQEWVETAAQLGFGTTVDPQSAAAALTYLASMFAMFGAIVCVIGVMASIGIFRANDKPEIAYRSYCVGLIGGLCSFACGNIISGVLLFLASKFLNSDYVDKVGEEVAYKNGKRLGFLRVVEFLCVIYFMAMMATILFVTRSSYFDAYYWTDFIQLLMMAVTLWLIWNRKEAGRKIIIGMISAYIIALLVLELAINDFDFLWFLYDTSVPIVVLCYFIFSKRVPAVMTQPMRVDKRAENLAEDEKLWNLKSPAFWRNLLLYFCVFSVIGHWMEWCVCWFIRWGLVPGTYDPNSGIWHDLLNPFFVYGAAMVLIGLFMFPIKNFCQKKIKVRGGALAASFVINSLFCAAIELGMGLVMNYPPDPVTGKLPLWDYTDMAFNFMGQICLLNTVFFGVMATLFTWLVYPNLEKIIAKTPRDVMNVITVIVLIFFVLLVAMYVINLTMPGIVINGTYGGA